MITTERKLSTHRGQPENVVQRHQALGWVVARRTRWYVYLKNDALPGTTLEVKL